MKKSHIIILILVIAVVLFFGYEAYDIYRDTGVPDYGEWYCEELQIGIDFDCYRCADAKRYKDDGTYKDLMTYFNYNRSVYEICECGGPGYNRIVYGDIFRHKNTFAIRNYDDGHIYKFVLVEE